MQLEGQYNICCGLLQSVSTNKMVDLCHLEDFQLAWDGSGFCNRWLKKWFLGLISAPWIRGTGLGEIINMYYLG